MSKVFIGVGHGGSAPGAVGILVEKDVNLKMALACRDYLVSRGVDVLMSRTVDEDETLSSKIAECNSYNPDLAIECHNNAGGGDGFEIYHSIVGGVGKTLAKNIETEVLAIGQNSRGLKTRQNGSGTDYFGFIRQTICPAVICEGAFVDNQEDAAQIDTDSECKAFGEAYARGVLKTLGISFDEINPVISEPTEAPRSDGYLVKVTTDALNIREGAGTNYKVNGVIRDNGVYTIVDNVMVGNIKWGKLKSGAGWIALNYTKAL